MPTDRCAYCDGSTTYRVEASNVTYLACTNCGRPWEPKPDPTPPHEERERYDLWRAIHLLVEEIGSRGDTSQWFRQEWEKLVNERNGTRDE